MVVEYFQQAGLVHVENSSITYDLLWLQLYMRMKILRFHRFVFLEMCNVHSSHHQRTARLLMVQILVTCVVVRITTSTMVNACWNLKFWSTHRYVSTLTQAPALILYLHAILRFFSVFKFTLRCKKVMRVTLSLWAHNVLALCSKWKIYFQIIILN